MSSQSDHKEPASEKRISACILTKNNEYYIERCLDALCSGDVFSEILVLDTGSTDTTLEILERYSKVKVFHQNGIANFGETRNFISEKAENDWLLHIDSDEFVSPEFLAELAAISLDPETVYEIPRRMFYRGKSLPAYDDRIKRLYNRTRTAWNQRAVHESIKLGKGMKLAHLHAPIEHHSYESVDQLFHKAQVYSTLFANQYYGKKKASPWGAVLRGLGAFARLYFLRGNFFRGYAGFITSLTFSLMSFLKYVKLYERNSDWYGG